MVAASRMSVPFAIALLALCACAPLHAASRAGPDPSEDPAMLDAGYQRLHPDLEYRQLGIRAYRRGQLETALARFRRAGYYGDKPSQALAAEMYWKGEGAPADRATAYIWMDLAAERGYPDLVQLRERYWAAMSADERKLALAQGPALYRIYGDPTVKPRYERELRRQRNQLTGSHLGMDVGLGGGRADQPDFGDRIPPTGLYAEANWDAKRYWADQDAFWLRRSGGKVNVGTLEHLGDAQSGAQPDAGDAAQPPHGEAKTGPTPQPDRRKF